VVSLLLLIQGNGAAAAHQAQDGLDINAVEHAEPAPVQQLPAPAAVHQAAALWAFVRVASVLNAALVPVLVQPVAAVAVPLVQQAQPAEQAGQDGADAVQVVLQSSHITGIVYSDCVVASCTVSHQHACIASAVHRFISGCVSTQCFITEYTLADVSSDVITDVTGYPYVTVNLQALLTCMRCLCLCCVCTAATGSIVQVVAANPLLDGDEQEQAPGHDGAEPMQEGHVLNNAIIIQVCDIACYYSASVLQYMICSAQFAPSVKYLHSAQ
jgi:hypothetical protein